MKASGLAPILAALTVALMLVATAGLNGVSAQSAVDYDADDDGLIEIEWLEQLDAVRWDLDGDGVVDDEGNAEKYAAAFPDAAEGMGCAEGCRGYELTRDLDFKSARSYASGAVNSRWTSGNGWLPIGVSLDRLFQAIFEGNDHTIANLYINRSGDNQPEVSGLFGFNEGGAISRIGLVNVDIYQGQIMLVDLQELVLPLFLLVMLPVVFQASRKREASSEITTALSHRVTLQVVYQVAETVLLVGLLATTAAL